LVIGETNAYGCPMLITNTGGTESLLIPGQNGQLFDPTATGEDFADAVIALTQTRAQYDALSKSSFEHCHARMVWSVWGTSLRDTLRDFQKAGRLHPPGTAA
jgi:glycosyltransferase involved in cell wall biosynthesis